MKKLIPMLLSLALLMSIGVAASAEAPWDISATVYVADDVQTTAEEAEAGLPIFMITMENGDTMRGELYPQTAPESVGNFIALANSGFYDGLTFHRVIPGFVVQGGDPLGNGTGYPGWRIKGEFALNGIENPVDHSYGVLSMARRPDDYNSAGSQFFITLGDVRSLDGEYAAFGKVLEGMAVAEVMAATPRDGNDKPETPQSIQSIRVETFGQEYPFSQL